MLTKCWIDSTGAWKPICAAYGHRWLMPAQPPTINDWCLALILTSAHQMDAATQDPRVQVYRTPFAQITDETVTTYASQGAEPGMSLGELLDVLSAENSNYGMTDLHNWT
jgi:hypothetical protein